MKEQLDFIVIGAQKSGTTTLFKLLENHPDIYMPPEKEIPYYSKEAYSECSIKEYLAEFFALAPAEASWGKASPQYMADPRVPERIYSDMPDVKLIAILRNPIERAVSHYIMLKRRGLLTQEETFAEQVDCLVESRDKARKMFAGVSSESSCILAWGEYGRILSSYLNLFSRDQLKVIFLDDLNARPAEVMKSIYSFLGVDNSFVPNDLDKKFHVGGDRARFSFIRDLFKKGLVRRVWMLLPAHYRRYLRYWFDQKVVVKGYSVEDILTSDVQHKLVEYYMQDIEQLEKIIGTEVPWNEFKGGK